MTIWEFFTNFVPLKLTCLVTLFDRKFFKKSPKLTIFGIFNELLSTQNVNVALLAMRNETFCVNFKHRACFCTFNGMIYGRQRRGSNWSWNCGLSFLAKNLQTKGTNEWISRGSNSLLELKLHLMEFELLGEFCLLLCNFGNGSSLKNQVCKTRKFTEKMIFIFVVQTSFFRF